MRDYERFQILTVEDVAALLHVSASTVRRLFASGRLPARKPGKRWLTTADALKQYLGSENDGRR